MGKVKMTALDYDLLSRCAAGENITSSDRERDRARTKLKRLGFLIFERPNWRWVVTSYGRALLASHEQQDESPDDQGEDHLGEKGI